MTDAAETSAPRSRAFPRIVHVSPALFGAGGVLGGAERYAFELARHMAEVAPTRLISFSDKPRVEHAGPLEIRVLGPSWFVRGQRSNPWSTQLLRELRDAAIIHCHQQHIVASSVSAVFARLTGRKVFVTDLGGGGWDVSAYLSTDRWYHAHLHLSEYSRRVFRHEGKPWAHVILGGVDSAKFSPPARENARDRVVFVGRILPHKGINYLIEALPSGLALDIIGQPYDKVYLEELRGLAAGKSVRFLHEISDEQLITAYRSALCVVLPSVYRTMHGKETKVPELLGQTLLEGMACGAPAICTNVASLPEIVEHGISGFVVKPNDPRELAQKISHLREHPEDARRLGSAARERVLEKFTWPAVVQRCLQVYSL